MNRQLAHVLGLGAGLVFVSAALGVLSATAVSRNLSEPAARELGLQSPPVPNVVEAGGEEIEWAADPLPYADPLPETLAGRLGLDEGTDGHTSFVATSRLPVVAAYLEPDDESLPLQRFASPTQFGGPRVFLITDAQTDWLQVLLPVRPNGTIGWVRVGDVTVSQVSYRAEVNLSTATVAVWDGDALILDTSVAYGKDETPTPVGRFYLRDIIVKSTDTGPYGSHILALSGFSDVIEEFGGGLPAIALHGTNAPELLGGQVSSGCVRLLNADIAVLANVLPLGTPVDIVA